MTSLAKNTPSLCIPRAFGNITKKRVMDVIKECQFGMVERIDEISKVNDNGETVKRFFVHFKHWFKGWDAERNRLMSGESERLKIVYDDPWYWMVKASDPAAAYKPRESGGKQPKKKVFVSRDEVPKAVAVDAEQNNTKKRDWDSIPEVSRDSTPVSTDHLKIDLAAASPTAAAAAQQAAGSN